MLFVPYNAYILLGVVPAFYRLFFVLAGFYHVKLLRTCSVHFHVWSRVEVNHFVLQEALTVFTFHVVLSAGLLVILFSGFLLHLRHCLLFIYIFYLSGTSCLLHNGPPACPVI